MSPAEGKVQGVNHDEKGDQFPVDVPLAQANAGAYDALLLPGGVMNPDNLRVEPAAVEFVKAFADANKPIATICHGPWTLVEADLVRGRTMTSFPSIKTDLKNAGAHWVDQAVVHDGTLITSRNPNDIPAFSHELIETLAQTTPQEQSVGVAA